MTRPLSCLVLLSGCDSCLPTNFRATHKAGFERMAAERLRVCVQGNPCQFVSQCFRESGAYCVDAGYAKECGRAEPETTCDVGVK